MLKSVPLCSNAKTLPGISVVQNKNKKLSKPLDDLESVRNARVSLNLGSCCATDPEMDESLP
jgi:hypothetical protein